MYTFDFNKRTRFILGGKFSRQTYFFMGLGKKYELPPINIPPNPESSMPITIHIVVKRVDRYNPVVKIINPIDKQADTFFIFSSKSAFLNAT